jgi:hypothetical protein
MTDAIDNQWPYPGSRWWKFDFHTHTPASRDTKAWQDAIGTPQQVTPEIWLSKYMAAEIDCVAITDHNSGDWIDRLKEAYVRMQASADANDFRPLHIFPGVEISVHGGFHLLAIFDPSKSTGDIDTLRGNVQFDGTTGDCDGVTRKGAADVVQAILEAGGIPIPAHADGDKGLLAVREGTRQCRLDTATVMQVLDNDALHAVEWVNLSDPLPECAEKHGSRLVRVLGSDCHNFQGNARPGSRYTWVKMATPSIEGLRLALLDGKDISIRRSDQGSFDPFKTPANFVSKITIRNARYMGNGNPETLLFTPFCNALIGGRGTGKSTVLHATRLAYRRDEELKHLRLDAGPRKEFERFRQVVKGRDGEGALRDNTEIGLELVRDGVRHRLWWRAAEEKGAVVEVQTADGSWETSSSQAVTSERFPIRLFSQGQIAALAGEDRRALLEVIDQAAEITPLHRALEEARRTYFAQRARLRQLDGRLSARAELERKSSDLSRKLETFTQSRHADILKAHQLAVRQCREIDTTLQQLSAMPSRLESLVQDLLLDDWPEGVFETTVDADALAWRYEVDDQITGLRKSIDHLRETLLTNVVTLKDHLLLSQWRARTDKACGDYEALRNTLAAQGVNDPQAFGRLVQDRQQLEAEIRKLDQERQDRDRLQLDLERQWQQVLTARQAITRARSEFLREKLQNNTFVRMSVEPFGFDPRTIERSLREMLDVVDERFEMDILHLENGEATSGIAFDLAHGQDRIALLETVKTRLTTVDNSLGGRFRSFLQKALQKPELEDHIQCWFPEDDLRIEYSRTGDGQDFKSITQGSPGQRAAALLAFLLAFGDEPLLLDQPEDDLDNHLIYELIVRQIRENKLRRQLIVVTHNPNVVVNGDAEMIHVFDFVRGQCHVRQNGALQQKSVRDEVCHVMEGGHEAFARRWARLGKDL